MHLFSLFSLLTLFEMSLVFVYYGLLCILSPKIIILLENFCGLSRHYCIIAFDMYAFY